jgi:hypothetical protein
MQGTVTLPNGVGYAVFPEKFQGFRCCHIMPVRVTFYGADNEQVFVTPGSAVPVFDGSHTRLSVNILFLSAPAK